MANIAKYQTSLGETRYRVRYRKPDGSQTDKRGFRRKIDAENWAAEHVTIAKATNSYIDPQAGRKPMEDLWGQLLAERRPLWKPSTRVNMEYSWDHYCKPKWAQWHVGDVTQSAVQQWTGELSERSGAPTAQRATLLIRDVCAIAVRDRLIASNPCTNIDMPRQPNRKGRRVYLTAERLMAFADEAGRSRRLGPERRALILTLGLTGLRWGEAAALRARDVDLDALLLHVRRNLVYVGAQWHEGTPKNGLARDVPMPGLVADLLKPIVADRKADDRVFRDAGGGPIRKQSIARRTGWYAQALKRLGWDEADWPVPHDLRHTAASLAVHAGANVKALQRMLGHSSAALTLDVYADLFDSDLMDVARALDGMIREECGQNVGSEPAGGDGGCRDSNDSNASGSGDEGRPSSAS